MVCRGFLGLRLSCRKETNRRSIPSNRLHNRNMELAKMRFIILKFWPSVPECKQPGFRGFFNSREEALRKVEELKPLFPGREFIVKEVKSGREN